MPPEIARFFDIFLRLSFLARCSGTLARICTNHSYSHAIISKIKATLWSISSVDRGVWVKCRQYNQRRPYNESSHLPPFPHCTIKSFLKVWYEFKLQTSNIQTFKLLSAPKNKEFPGFKKNVVAIFSQKAVRWRATIVQKLECVNYFLLVVELADAQFWDVDIGKLVSWTPEESTQLIRIYIGVYWNMGH